MLVVFVILFFSTVSKSLCFALFSLTNLLSIKLLESFDCEELRHLFQIPFYSKLFKNMFNFRHAFKLHETQWLLRTYILCWIQKDFKARLIILMKLELERTYYVTLICSPPSALVISSVHFPWEAQKKLQNPLTFAIIVSFKLSWCMKYPWNRNLEMAFRMEKMYFAEYRTLGQEVAYT